MAQFLKPDAQPTWIHHVRVIDPQAGIDRISDLLISPDGLHLDAQKPEHSRVIDGTGLWAVPGLIDLQVHFREPGFEYKETIESGSRAALAGGITTAVVMPNTRPALDHSEAVLHQMTLSQNIEGIRILVAAAATRNIAGEQLTDYCALKKAGAVAVTDDGFPVVRDDIMRESLKKCVENDLLFMQHAEDPLLSNKGVMTEGPTSRMLGLPGQLADAEGAMVERDLRLAQELGARYHVLHLSTARSLEAVRKAKAAGVRVTCEVSPHHLLLTDEDVCGLEGQAQPHFKMNPPLRSKSDRQALLHGLREGLIDAVATDHAPHSADEKAKGFLQAPFGIVGLETSFAAIMSLVHEGLITEHRAIELMTSGPARVLNRKDLGSLISNPDLTLIDPTCIWTVSVNDLFGSQKNSPFIGKTFKGKVIATFLRGCLRFLSRKPAQNSEL